MSKRYQVQSRAKSSDPSVHEIIMHGPIGKSWWSDEGISAKEFTDALNAIPAGTKIEIGINSQGGAVGEGLAIYNAIKRRSSDITCRIDGYALSIASFIPLAASRIFSPKSSIWMIHKAWSYSQGNADQMRKDAEMLDAHDAVLCAGYVEHTGKSEEEVNAALAAETWFTGEEAMDWGLSTECTDDDCELEPMDFARFSNAPTALLVAASLGSTIKISGGFARKSTAIKAANSGAATTKDTMNKAKIIAVLAKYGVKVADDATDETILAELGKLVTAGTVTEKEKLELTASAETKTASPSSDAGKIVVNLDEFQKLQASVEAERKARITAEVNRLVEDRPSQKAEDWILRAMQDESVLALLRGVPVENLGAAPVTRTVSASVIGDYRDTIKSQPKGWKKIHFIRDNWDELVSAEASLLRRNPQAANTTSATVKTSMLQETVTTVLQDQLAPVSAFGLDVGADPYKPLATVVSKKVTAGGTVQTNATNFEDTTNFVATATAVSVSMNQYTGGGYLTQAELNSGYRMMDWAVIKSAEFANKLWDVVSALFTTANFTNTPFVAAAGAFSGDDMATIWGQIQKAPVKGMVLDGNYFARLLGKNTFDFNDASGDVRTLRWPGWGTIGYSTRWSAAGSNVYGIAGANSMVRVVSGLPLVAPTAAASGLRQGSISIGNTGIVVQTNEWFSNSTRNDWFTFDIIFGAAVDDATAGILIKSA